MRYLPTNCPFAGHEPFENRAFSSYATQALPRSQGREARGDGQRSRELAMLGFAGAYCVVTLATLIAVSVLLETPVPALEVQPLSSVP